MLRSRTRIIQLHANIYFVAHKLRVEFANPPHHPRAIIRKEHTIPYAIFQSFPVVAIMLVVEMEKEKKGMGTGRGGRGRMYMREQNEYNIFEEAQRATIADG